ncbi:AP2/ERF and B3 domain-containing protein [Carex littledalei]|uniref:AP2/ERF and B3 domain-containing protein n=1 Tax=Carex littledalei TaxID=544730 RepID=A0A833VSH3_9POAL|nr:AP2/ERF and B3 domain-containing protein [Carex littledalei]
MTKGWRLFVKEKGVKEGDVISFWSSLDEAGFKQYLIDIFHRPSDAASLVPPSIDQEHNHNQLTIRLFGVDICKAEANRPLEWASLLLSRQEATLQAIAKSQDFQNHQLSLTYAQVTSNTPTAVNAGLTATQQTPVLLRRKEATINAISRAASTYEPFNNVKARSVLLHKKEATVNAIRVANQMKTAGSTSPQREHALNQEAQQNLGEDTVLKQRDENQPPKEEGWTTAISRDSAKGRVSTVQIGLCTTTQNHQLQTEDTNHTKTKNKRLLKTKKPTWTIGKPCR